MRTTLTTLMALALFAATADAAVVTLDVEYLIVGGGGGGGAGTDNTRSRGGGGGGAGGLLTNVGGTFLQVSDGTYSVIVGDGGAGAGTAGNAGSDGDDSSFYGITALGGGGGGGENQVARSGGVRRWRQ